MATMPVPVYDPALAAVACQLPSGLATVTLTGRYLTADGCPLKGTVTFCPPQVVTAPAQGITLTCCTRATLDENGAFSVVLTATDAPGIVPQDWTYQVREEITCRAPRTFSIRLTKDIPVQNLASLTPVPPFGGNTILVPIPSDLSGGIVNLAPTLVPDGDPQPVVQLPFVSTPGLTDCEVVAGGLRLDVTGLWTIAGVVDVLGTTPAASPHTSDVWLEWQEGTRTRSTPKESASGEPNTTDGFDNRFDFSVVLDAGTVIKVMTSNLSLDEDAVTVSGRVGIALAMRQAPPAP